MGEPAHLGWVSTLPVSAMSQMMGLIKLSLGSRITSLRDEHLASHYYPESERGKGKKA
jgi:hypothetical protein